jgi:hypothetical protein
MHVLHDVPAGVCQQGLHVAAAGLLFAFKDFNDDASWPSSRRDAPPVANTSNNHIEHMITMYTVISVVHLLTSKQRTTCVCTQQACVVKCVLHSTTPPGKLHILPSGTIYGQRGASQ